MHHGVVTREELLDMGLTGDTIDHALGTSVFDRAFAGVYRIRWVPDTWRGRALAAVRRVERQQRRREPPGQSPPLVALAGTGAAHLHGLPGHDRPGPITVVTARRCRSRTVAVERRSALTAGDVVLVDRIPVTSLAWTTVETAGRVDDVGRGDVLAGLVIAGRLHVAELAEVADRAVGVPKRPRVLTALRAGAPRHRSRTERRVIEACGSAGLPTPEVNVVVRTVSGRSYEIDLLWRWANFAVEVDGFHHLEPGQRRRDRERDHDLGDGGIRVLRIPVQDVDEDIDDDVARIGRRLHAGLDGTPTPSARRNLQETRR